ncbi:MAG: hypothetical protein ABH843_04420 [Candidatus Omnitrophota bacterium]
MSNKTILALGADIKSRFLVAKNGRIYLGPEIGDLSLVENYEVFKREASKAIKRFKPNIIAYDLHPGYFSSRFAKSLHPAPYTLHPAQHHHAHIASVLQEHKIKGPVIGVSFDGTGYGSDGNMWGGEFLLVQGAGFKRLAHLKYRMMPGGERVVHEPWRMVLSILGDKGVDIIRKVPKEDKALVLSMMLKNINSPLSSSAGRLFDAAAALLGICTYASYEAEGPIKLEALCDENISDTYIKSEVKVPMIDTDIIFNGMLKDIKKKRPKEVIATKFHNSISDIIVMAVDKLSRRLGIKRIALSGGVFQNQFLKKKVIKSLISDDKKVYINSALPVNDSNIALGQYYVSRDTGKN